MKFLSEIDPGKLKDKRILIRVDFNVPLDDAGNITDDNRIAETIPTISFILNAKPKQIVLMSHLGKAKGKPEEKLKMDKAAKRLQELLKKQGIKADVAKADDCIGIDYDSSKFKGKEIIVLENLRFHAEEEKNDESFAKKLAAGADVYVNDAFGTCHRAHASVAAVTKFIPNKEVYAGLLVEKEVKIMGGALKNPKRPFIAIMGGAKVSDKILVIQNLLKKVDCLLVGGAMMFTFLKSTGVEVGKSKCENDRLDIARKLLEGSNSKIILPTDAVVATELPDAHDVKTVSVDDIPANMIGLDIGKETVEAYREIISKAKTIVWNGPMGMFEPEEFAKGTEEIAKAVAEATQKNSAVSIIGGGDSAAAIDQLGLKKKVTHVSTGGGASLDFLAGADMPGLDALNK